MPVFVEKAVTHKGTYASHTYIFMLEITDKHATYLPQQTELTCAPIFPSTHTEPKDHTPSRDLRTWNMNSDMFWNCPGLAWTEGFRD